MPRLALHTANQAATPDHYENFPVASWLCPPALRAPISAIYGFARTADDIADEGDAPAAQRLHDLTAIHDDLLAVHAGKAHSGRWPHVFDALQLAMVQFALPVSLLADLLSAFKQDVNQTQTQAGYATQAELLDYCRRSANPIGRLLLHLYRIDDPRLLGMSDQICTALQLINFWQDLGVDIPRGRYYVPDDACSQFQVTRAELQTLRPTESSTKLVEHLVGHAKSTMLAGAPLVKSLPGRAGWELRLVVQGGLRIVDKIESMNFATLAKRPTITAWDAPTLFWRALKM